MSTIFTHLLLSEFSLKDFFFFACLTCAYCCSNLFWSLSIVLPLPRCHLELSLCQPQMNKSVNQLLRPQNQIGVPFLPICILCMRLSKDTWLCQHVLWVSPLFHYVDSKRLQIWRGWLPGWFCTTWAMLLSTVWVCKWVHGLSVLNVGMRHWIKNEHAQPWLVILLLMHLFKGFFPQLLFNRPLKKWEKLKLK